MNFDIPEDIQHFLGEVDAFIEEHIKPLEGADDNIRFFDHRREDARTDWDRQGLPNKDWEALLAVAKQRAIAAGIFSYPFQRSMEAGTAATLAWPLSENISRLRDLVCTTICKTSTRSWATI